MSCCSSCSSGSCFGCKIFRLIYAFVLTLIVLAAFVGVWRTHVLANGMVYGTPDGSLALLVFIIALHFWYRTVKVLCPCRSAGCCSACGSDPCTCGHSKK